MVVVVTMGVMNDGSDYGDDDGDNDDGGGWWWW